MAVTNSLDHLSNRMKLEWYSKLSTDMVPAKNFRRTSIICTIGMSKKTSGRTYQGGSGGEKKNTGY